MNKNTLTFERKLYTAPVCKTHVLQVEENIMSGNGEEFTPQQEWDGNEGWK